ncbi:MAG: TonB-dependent receptor plug domain-containing protein, partial [Burkholderiaceae bacterium]|nr:TonB-dependent receptor plug domain-containing protein [Burkholderiaceae bacterium]
MFFLAQVRKFFARDYFFLLLAIGFPLASHAQMTLPVTVVTATKVPQRVEDVLADVSVVSREDIVASGAATVETFLATLPGIQMVSTGQAGVYMRGADPRMVAVFIDGVRVDYQDKNGAGARFAQIPLSTVERIEVIRGPVSGVYGANAMAG